MNARKLDNDTEVVTLRQYLTVVAVAQGAGLFTAVEAVATTALSHPDWDLDGCERSWNEWNTWMSESESS